MPSVLLRMKGCQSSHSQSIRAMSGQLHRILKDLATKQFDVIFFSPFSHGRLAEVKALLASNTVLSSRANIEALIDSIIGQTQLLLDEISKRFECPILYTMQGLL